MLWIRLDTDSGETRESSTCPENGEWVHVSEARRIVRQHNEDMAMEEQRPASALREMMIMALDIHSSSSTLAIFRAVMDLKRRAGEEPGPGFDPTGEGSAYQPATCQGEGPAKAAGPINELAKEIIAINTANGWNVLKPEQWADTYKIPGILALIHSEVSEALEAFRKGDKANFLEELADVMIRVMDCSGGLGLDIDAAIRAKLEKNKGRGFRHGGKRV